MTYHRGIEFRWASFYPRRLCPQVHFPIPRPDCYIPEHRSGTQKVSTNSRRDAGYVSNEPRTQLLVESPLATRAVVRVERFLDLTPFHLENGGVAPAPLTFPLVFGNVAECLLPLSLCPITLSEYGKWPGWRNGRRIGLKIQPPLARKVAHGQANPRHASELHTELS